MKLEKILDNLGYNLASSSHLGLNTQNNINLRELKRSEIIASDNLKILEKKILGYYDYL